MSLILFLVAAIGLPPRFSMSSSSRCIDGSTPSSMLASPLPPFLLDTFNMSTSSQGCNALCIIISFLVLWSICSRSSLVHFKNGIIIIIIIIIDFVLRLASFILLRLLADLKNYYYYYYFTHFRDFFTPALTDAIQLEFD